MGDELKIKQGVKGDRGSFDAGGGAIDTSPKTAGEVADKSVKIVKTGDTGLSGTHKTDAVDTSEIAKLRTMVEAQGKTIDQLVVRNQEQQIVLDSYESNIHDGDKLADDAKTKSSLMSMRTLVEVFEFVGRIFTPFFAMISLFVRIIRIIAMLLTGRGKDIKWKRELTRLAIDAVGLVPGIGGAISAVGNQAANMYWGSEPFGGIEYLFDMDKPRVESPFRGVFEKGASAVKGVVNWGKDAIGLGSGKEKAPDGPVDHRKLTTPPRAAEVGI